VQKPSDTTALPEGGRLEQLENYEGKPVFPLTVMEGVFRQSDGKSLAEVLAEMEQGAAGPEDAAPSVEAANLAPYITNRESNVNAADTSYGVFMARGIAAGTSDLTAGSSSLTSGCIYLVYE